MVVVVLVVVLVVGSSSTSTRSSTSNPKDLLKTLFFKFFNPERALREDRRPRAGMFRVQVVPDSFRDVVHDGI